MHRILHALDGKIASGVYTITNVTTGKRAILRGADIDPPRLTVSNELGAANEVSNSLLPRYREITVVSVEY